MITEILQRLRAPMPLFFKKILLRLVPASGTLVVTCGTALGSYGSTMNEFTKGWLQIGLGIGLASGTIGTFIASLTIDWSKTDPKDVPNVTPPKLPEDVLP